MKGNENKPSISQQESNEIIYTSKIFPHISSPSKRIEDLSKCLWELFSYGTLSEKEPNSIQFLLSISDFNIMSTRKKTMLIRAYKNKVAQINKYGIEDDELIFALLRQVTFRMIDFLKERDIYIIAELIRSPLISNTELSKRIGLSRTYVSRRRKKLTNDGIVLNKLFVDPHYFGLSHHLFLFIVNSEAQQTFEELFMQNPYLMTIKKSPISPIKENNVLYLLSFYVPYKQEKRFFMWINQQKHHKLVTDYYSLKVYGFGHSINLHQLDREKWNFDVSRDIILSFKFTQDQHQILSINENFKAYMYSDKINNTFTYEDLLVISLLNEDPHLSLSDLKKHLTKYGLSLSKASLWKIKNKLNDVVHPYVRLDNIGLNSTLIVFVWEPFLSKEENDYLTKYFANNFPQVIFNFSRDGFFAVAELPSYGEITKNVLLAALRKNYPDSMIFLTLEKFWVKHIGNLIPYWDKKKRTWRLEDWMLPNININGLSNR